MALRRFHGIVPPMVTPLTDRDSLDHSGLERLVEHLILGGIHGLFVLGTTGEAPSLSYRLRRELIARVCKLVDRRIPILVGITDTSFVETVGMARAAADSGADALVLATPYYFPAGQTELFGYIENLMRELPLPLMLYNMPSLTKVWFEQETLMKLTQFDSIVGIKDSSGDLEYFGKLKALRSVRPDWSIMIGPEAMLPQAMKLEGDGGVAGGANVFPNLFVACYDAIIRNDLEAIDRWSEVIQDFQAIYEIGKYASRYIKATKCSVSLLGICDDFMAEPFHRFLPPERARVAAVLDAIRPRLP